MASSVEAEKVLKKLRKLEANMVCPNCATKAVPGVGFGNVCMKFKTFICDLCKTSHQAISHRVKSFSMSTWTMDEVLDLTIERNGGNEAALHIWLANAPPPGGKYAGGIRPKSGDDVNVFKRFVTDCYEHGKFKASTPFMPLANETNSINTNGARNASYHNHTGSNRSLAPPAPLAKTEPKSPKSLRKVGSGSNVKATTSSPDIDLLGFDISTPSSPPGSDFGSFSAAPIASNSVFDPFSSPVLATAPMSTESASFDPFGSNNTMVPALSAATSAFPTTASAFTASTPTLNPTNLHHFSMQPPTQQQQNIPTSTFSPSFDPFSSSQPLNNMGGNSHNSGGNNNGRSTADVLSLFDQAPPVLPSAATTTTVLNSNRAASIR